MSECPVCAQALSGTVCRACGYNRSLDYARYPTFVPIAPGTPSVSGRQRLRRRWGSPKLRCNSCACSCFSIALPEADIYCLDCGTRLSDREFDLLVEARKGISPAQSTPKASAVRKPVSQPSSLWGSTAGMRLEAAASRIAREEFDIQL